MNILIENLGDVFTVFFLSMLPITELQGGITYGLTILNMHPIPACLAGIAGSTTSAMLLISFLEPCTKWLRQQSKLFDRFFHWLFERTRIKYSESMSRLGHFALFGYIALPTPGSGAWTGALIAHLFGIPLKKSLPILGLGLISTGLIVTFGVEGLLLLFKGRI
jgi:uncharacterized membrane protein